MTKTAFRRVCMPLLAIVFLFIAVVFPSNDALAARAKENTRKLCAECHKETERYFTNSVVHAPVAKGECASCHNPHASKHNQLLSDSGDKLCFDCHDKNKVASGSVKHDPVQKGKCLECHDPHSSSSKGLLKKGGADICFNCHKKDGITVGRYVHDVVRKGDCLSCHASHSSSTQGLLKKPAAELCLKCHGKGAGKPYGAHLGYDVAKSDCATCHDPHASETAAMGRSKLHKPYQTKECSSCHVDPKNPARLTNDSDALCLKCHKESLNSFNKRYSHRLGGVSANMCLDCHTPHAGDERYMPKAGYDRMCYSCHATTEVQVKSSKHVHPSVARCFDCHAGHSSDNRSFMTLGSKTCITEKCHPAQGNFSHPQGDKVLDPRSKEPMDCVSCHDPMGTFEEYILKGERVTGVCQNCHKM